MKRFKVEFIDGPLNGAIRYYSSLRVARSVARRYVSRPIPGHVFFSTPCCELYFVSIGHPARFLEIIL